jgi:hypothetical protein
MKQLSGVVLAATLLAVLAGQAQADDKQVKAVLDKAIKALGGEEKLGTDKAFTWKTKGKITLGENESQFTSKATAQGVDRYHANFEGEFGGNKIMAVTVINADKGWRKFNDMTQEMGKDALANEKRNVALLLVPMTIVPLKGKGFKVKEAGEEKVGGKPAVVLEVTGPDKKTFKLSFDKESGLPVKLVAKVIGFMGEEFTQEVTYTGYKDFGGIKKATKMETKRDGEKFVTAEISDFKAVDKLDAKTFEEPK